MHMNEDEYRQLQLAVSAGETSLKIRRAMARRFYLRVKSGDVASKTGVSQLGQKCTVLAMLALSLISIAASLFMIWVNFDNAAIFAVPAVGIFWTVLVGFTTENGDLLFSSIGLVILTGLTSLMTASYALPVACFFVSILAYRGAHLLAEKFLLGLLTKSFVAFDMLSEHVEIVQHAA